MNILILSWRGPNHPNWGGAEIVTHEYAKAWVKAGHAVTLFTSGFPGVPTEESIDGVQVIRRGNQIGTIQIAAIFWCLFGKHKSFDVVVDQFHGIPFFTPLYLKSKKLAFIHEVAKEVWWSNHLRFPINFIYGGLGYVIEPLIFLLYRNTPFLTVSQSTKEDLIRWSIPSKNITVIPNGFTPISVKVAREEQPTLIFLGAVAKDKGIEDALVAFSQLVKTNPLWKFWVVGRVDRDYHGHLLALAERLHISPMVKFWGFVDEVTKFKLLARSHIMINSSRREGWGLVNIEASSVGTPVVAYAVPGCRDSVLNGKTGLLAEAGNIVALTACIQRVIEDKDLYNSMSYQSKEWSKSFSWGKATRESLELIESLTY